MDILTGHTSESTGYVVDDYPYGFRLRTQIRYWIETREGMGQRFCSQTLNPKSGQWNKPKCSTYSKIILLGINPENGYVQRVDIPFDETLENLRSFYSNYGNYFDEYQRAVFNLIYAAKVARDLHKADFDKVLNKGGLTFPEYTRIVGIEYGKTVLAINIMGLDRYIKDSQNVTND